MKTTNKDFASFKDYCLYWQKELGLNDWHIYFKHTKLNNSFADCDCSPSGRGAMIQFSTSWEDREINDKELRECALHEVMHVVTADFANEARSRSADEYTLESAEHSIVTRMTNYIMAKEK
jgi:hypothetical protein